jgi:hypothetical protein
MARTALLGALVSAVLLICNSAGQNRPQLSPDQLVRQVIHHELEAEHNDHSHWMLRLQETKPGTGTRTEEIVQTNQGWVRRLLAINGHPLNAKQRAQDDARMRKLISDPAQERKELQSLRNDAAQAEDLMKMLPDAFLYTYAGRNGDLVKLNFRPNPKFHPSSRKAAVFHDMVGSVTLDVKHQRLAAIQGHLNQEVKFAGGLLGHLDKGGSFEVKQSQIGPGVWDATYMNVEMNGKALFFKTIAVHEKDIRSDYHRVSDNLTLSQAAGLLEKKSNLVAQKH